LVGELAGGAVFALISGGKAGLVGVLANGTVSFASFFGTVVIVVVYSKSTRWATLTCGGLGKWG
jgi:membrane protein implicated in regulation of membrane protease activity